MAADTIIRTAMSGVFGQSSEVQKKKNEETLLLSISCLIRVESIRQDAKRFDKQNLFPVGVEPTTLRV